MQFLSLGFVPIILFEEDGFLKARLQFVRTRRQLAEGKCFLFAEQLNFFQKGCWEGLWVAPEVGSLEKLPPHPPARLGALRFGRDAAGNAGGTSGFEKRLKPGSDSQSRCLGRRQGCCGLSFCNKVSSS